MAISKRFPGRLAAVSLKKLHDGWHADGGNLYLFVREPSRSWVFRYVGLDGRRKNMGLGSMQSLTLAEARKQAANLRGQIKHPTVPIDPLSARQQQRHAARVSARRQMSFKKCGEAYIKAHEAEWKNAKHVKQWEAFDAIRLIPRKTKVLGFTGGEPTVYGQEFVNLVHHTKNWLPHTSLHVLSNGRSFADENFAYEYAKVQHPDLMIGIPIYSADPTVHDYVVQAEGAFDETVRGILNLKRFAQKVEIRVVLHKQTYKGLPELANYIARNLLFVDQVVLMGLEHTGFTRANIDALWIDPVDYKDELSEAIRILSNYRINAAVYNHPLCLVNPDVYPAYVKSISDWKNEFASECEPCTKKAECGGFFSSGLQNGYSHSINPFT